MTTPLRSLFISWCLLSSGGCLDSPEHYDFNGLPQPQKQPEQPSLPRQSPPVTPQPHPRTQSGPPRAERSTVRETHEWVEQRLLLSEILADFHAWIVDDKWVATLGLGPDEFALSNDSAQRWINFVHRSITFQPGKTLQPPPQRQRGAFELRVDEPLYYLTANLDAEQGAVTVAVEGKNAQVFADFLRSLPELKDQDIDPSKRIGTRFYIHTPKLTEPPKLKDGRPVPPEAK